MILGHSAPASPTGSPARTCVSSTAFVGVTEIQSFLGGKHAGSLEALRIAQPKAVDLERIKMFCLNHGTVSPGRPKPNNHEMSREVADLL